MKYTFFLVSAAILSTARCRLFPLYIKTDKGTVMGRSYQTIWNSLPYTGFFGIPYAKPPVGDLRFKDPVEAEPWSGTLTAIDLPSPCAQYSFKYPVGKEDCLYLNVYTPAIQIFYHMDLKPVMVWIYGGGVHGDLSKALGFSPVHLLEQEVVVVTLNYRVDVLGNLALGLPDASGNQGLKDQVMALKWVQKNIKAFGGDPNQVTLFGESSGAASVGYHLISTQSEGLFHKAILQSGSPLNPWAYQTPDQAVKNAFELGSRMGLNLYSKQKLLKSLKNANLLDLTRASNSMSQNEIFPIGKPFTATIETHGSSNSFLNECPISKLQGGVLKRMPILLGFNKNEALLPVSLGGKTQDPPESAQSKITIPIFKLFNSIVSKILDDVTDGSLEKVSKVASTYFFSGPIDIMQRYLALNNVNNPVYYYQLSYQNEYNFHKIFDPTINETTHGDDLSLLFHMTLNSPVNPDVPFNTFREKFMRMWANFAKYGDPTPDASVIGLRWKNSGKDGKQLDIGNDEYKMVDRVISTEDQLIENMYNKQLPSASDCNEIVWLRPHIF